MSWYVASTVDSVPDECFYFKNPGVYTIEVPAGASLMSYEIIGSGGGDGGTSTGGNGGYIKGFIDVTGFVNQTIHIYVGGPSNPLGFGSSASYITIPNSGPLFVMAGAGGMDGFLNTGTGGHGGGGTFTTNIANGTNGGTNGVVGAAGGGGGTTVGGVGAGTTNAAPPYLSPQNSGQSRPVSENYLEALGGASNVNGQAGPGGNGYTGGGGGGTLESGSGGGGGGSSYYNPTYTTVMTSYAGSNLPPNVLPNYGRNQTYGYVSVCFGTYIFVNSTNSYTIPANQLLDYTFLDYIIVSGGGGGGGGSQGNDPFTTANYGGGGGGSGLLKSSFVFNANNSGFNYNTGIYQGNRYTIPRNISSVIISIGNGGSLNGSEGTGGLGGDTSINAIIGGNPVPIDSSSGAAGGQASSSAGGAGGGGYNGGGGGGGGSSGGSGGPAVGGQGGQDGGGDNGGNGGGVGAGLGANIGGGAGDSGGGGGGAGSAVTLINGNRTGGDGGLRQVGVDNAGGSGTPYTGAGGGGGAYREGTYVNSGTGGSGYAIIWLHN